MFKHLPGQLAQYCFNFNIPGVLVSCAGSVNPNTEKRILRAGLDTRANIASVNWSGYLTNCSTGGGSVATSGGVTSASCTGDLRVKFKTVSGKLVDFTFSNVFVLPESENILLPVGKIEEMGFRLNIVDPANRKLLFEDYEFQVHKVNDLYEIDIAEILVSENTHTNNNTLLPVKPVSDQNDDWQILPKVFNNYDKRFGTFF